MNTRTPQSLENSVAICVVKGIPKKSRVQYDWLALVKKDEYKTESHITDCNSPFDQVVGKIFRPSYKVTDIPIQREIPFIKIYYWLDLGVMQYNLIEVVSVFNVSASERELKMANVISGKFEIEIYKLDDQSKRTFVTKFKGPEKFTTMEEMLKFIATNKEVHINIQSKTKEVLIDLGLYKSQKDKELESKRKSDFERFKQDYEEVRREVLPSKSDDIPKVTMEEIKKMPIIKEMKGSPIIKGITKSISTELATADLKLV